MVLESGSADGLHCLNCSRNYVSVDMVCVTFLYLILYLYVISGISLQGEYLYTGDYGVLV